MVDAKSPGLDGVRLSEVQWELLEKAVDMRRAGRRCEDVEGGEGVT